LVERGIPVPKVISYLEKPKSIGLETAIIDSADGVPMPEAHLPKEQKNKIYELLGEWLKKIHEIKLDGFGKLKIRNGKLQGKFASPKEYWESNKNNGHKAIDFLFDKELITEEEAKKIRGVYSEIEALEFGQASFLHRDLHQDHVFVKDGNISGIIDFASSMAGDPRQDIAMSLVFQNKEEREYFKKGYGELANDPMVQKYMMIIALHKILSRFKRKNEIDEKMLKLIKIF
jgi:aminoglycoside phosphotransferase (APT) family kinase protein